MNFIQNLLYGIILTESDRKTDPNLLYYHIWKLIPYPKSKIYRKKEYFVLSLKTLYLILEYALLMYGSTSVEDHIYITNKHVQNWMEY